MVNVLCVIIAGLIFVCVFVSGMLFMRSIIREAEVLKQYDEVRREYYALAGVKSMYDPLPYVPPITQRASLPCLDSLERRLRRGQRGTVMLKAKDRIKYGR